ENEIGKYLDSVFDTKNQRESQPSILLPHPPEKLQRLVDPSDVSLAIPIRARAYLQTNCAHCHILAGGGNAAMELEITTPLEAMKVFGVPPLHSTFGLDQPHIIAPGDPDRSIM